MQRGASDHAGRSGLFSPLALPLGVAFAATGLLDCSLLLNWSEYTDGTGGSESDGEASNSDAGEASVVDAGTGGDASADASRSGPRCYMTSPPSCCISAIPTGWTGPLEMYKGPLSALEPTCGPNNARVVFEGNEGLVFQPATCSKCTCDPPQGSKCIPPVLTAYSDAMCRTGTECGSPAPLSYTACAQTSCTAQAVSVTSAGVDDAGSCAHSTVTATKQPYTWTDAVRACALPSSSNSGLCRADEISVPLPPPQFGPRWCIMSSGEVACPPDSEFSVVYTTHTNDPPQDTRDCSECSCESPQGGSCWISRPTAAGVPYGDSMCLTPLAYEPFTVPTSCQPLAAAPPAANFKLIEPIMLDAGGCAADGGQPTGTVTPGPAVTFCCTP